MPFDAFAAAGLYDANHPKAHERRELLQHLLDRGYAAKQIIAAWEIRHRFRADGAANAFSLTTILNGAEHDHFLTAEEVADRCDVTPEEINEVRTTFGFPPLRSGLPDIAPTFVEDFALYQAAAAVYGKERTLAMARVVGAAIAAMIEAARELVAGPVQDGHPTELDLSQANEVGVVAWQGAQELVAHLMRESLTRDNGFFESLIRGELFMAVGFVDLVGSTEWTARMSAGEHAAAITRFEAAANYVAVLNGARIVKFIGDAAMIVGVDADGVAAAVALLCRTAHDDGVLPDARGSVGWGPVQARGGDYYGDVVNLAARATKEAPIGGLVVTADVAAKLDPARWSMASVHTIALRGIAGDVELVEATLL